MSLPRTDTIDNAWVVASFAAGVSRHEIATTILEALRAAEVPVREGSSPHFIRHTFLEHGTGSLQTGPGGKVVLRPSRHLKTLWAALDATDFATAVDICIEKAPWLLFLSGDDMGRSFGVPERLSTRLSRQALLDTLAKAADRLQTLDGVDAKELERLRCADFTRLMQRLVHEAKGEHILLYASNTTVAEARQLLETFAPLLETDTITVTRRVRRQLEKSPNPAVARILLDHLLKTLQAQRIMIGKVEEKVVRGTPIRVVKQKGKPHTFFVQPESQLSLYRPMPGEGVMIDTKEVLRTRQVSIGGITSTLRSAFFFPVRGGQRVRP